MQEFLKIVSFLAFYLGGANSIFARFAGTCTQGDADRLAGAGLSAVLYGLAFVALHFVTKKRPVVLATIPLWPIWIWQTVFTFDLSVSLVKNGHTACTFLEGIPSPESGHELLFSALWILVTGVLVIGGMVVWRLRRGLRKES